MRTIVLAAVLAAACPVLARDRVFDILGGSGGVEFAARCPSGQVLAGLQLRGGDDVDSVRPVCATPTGPAALGPLQPFPSKFGGDGGSDVPFICPADNPVAIGMWIRAFGIETWVVRSLGLYCGLAERNQLPAKHLETRLVFNGAPIQVKYLSLLDDQHCAEGMVAVGIRGRSGQFVDGLGLICGEIPATAAEKKAGLGNPGKRRIPSGQSAPAIIYGVQSDTNLLWYRHSGAAPGNAGTWVGSRNIGSGAGYSRLYNAGGDLYVLRDDGTLLWPRHRGKSNGTAVWDPAIDLGSGWDQYAHVIPTENGIVYTVSADGAVAWHRNNGWAEGKADWSPAAEIATGWTDVKRVFYGGEGVLYIITDNGLLWWRKHNGRDNGTAEWSGPKQIGNGWGDFHDVFSPGRGVIYAVKSDNGDLLWYRYLDYFQGSNTTWEGPVKVGTSWSTFRTLAAVPAQ